jgi:hypothetical protein
MYFSPFSMLSDTFKLLQGYRQGFVGFENPWMGVKFGVAYCGRMK